MAGNGLGWFQTASGSIGNTVTLISQQPSRLGGWYIDNTGGAATYLQFFDAGIASAITLGTTAPKLSINIPAGGAANLEIVNGIRFVNGIFIAATTTRAGNTNPAATVDYNLWLDTF